MSALDVAVKHVANKVVESTERQRVIGLIESMADDCKAATNVWQNYLKQPSATPADTFNLMNWIGSAAAKQLFNLHLAFRTKMLAVTGGRGNLEDPVIVQAYAPVKEGQTGGDAATVAVASMQKATAAMQAYANLIRNTKPVASKASQKPVAKVAKSKPAKAKKPAAKSKPANVKKSAAKSKTAPKKKTPMKKSTVKKSVKKVVKKAIKKAAMKSAKKSVKPVVKKAMQKAAKNAVKKKSKKK